MNTVVPLLPSASAVGTGPEAPSVQPGHAGSWDATLAAAQAHASAESQQPAAAAAAGANRRTSDAAGSAADAPSPGKTQTYRSVGAVIVRPVTQPVKGGDSPPANQSTRAGAAASPSRSADPGEDIASGAPTESIPPGGAGAPPKSQAPTPDVKGKPTGGTTRSTASADQSRASARTAQADAEARTDGVSPHAQATDSGASPRRGTASAKPDQPNPRAAARTDQPAGRTTQPTHAASQALASAAQTKPAAPQALAAQAALTADPLLGMGPAKKPGDRGSIAVMAGAVAGTAAPSPPTAAAVHVGSVAAEPEAAAQELLYHTTANLAGGGGSARIVLSPPTLGQVEVHVTMANSGAAHIAITAATAEGYAALTASHAGLLQHLAHRGVTIGSVQTQLQGGAGQNGASGRRGQHGHSRPAPTVSWIGNQDETVIAYA